MSFFNELKQRNVFKVAIAYTVVGWLLIQVAEVVAPQMNLPDWTSRMVTFVVMLGFPVSLIMAWALELTPEGVKKAEGDNLPVYIIAAVLLALSVYWFIGKENTTPVNATVDTTRPEPATSSTKRNELPSVAVLPFVNMSSDSENEYFSDGMTEELLNLLVDIDGLRVPSRTSSFAFKGQNTDIRDIAEQLKVEHILEGSVRKSGSNVRITAQLIDVATDTHLWSETYDRELKDIFAIQDEIAGHIVDALQLTLAPTRSAPEPTRNMEAYNLYLQGRFLMEQRGISLQEAERLLLQAIELDPGFGEAYASLAMTYALFPSYLGMAKQEPHAKAVEMAEKALAIDPDLIEASMSIAQVHIAASRWQEGIDRYEMITAQNPRHALAQLWYGISLLEAGYLSRALEVVNTSVGLDPVSGLTLDWQARLLIMNGRAAEAESIAQRAIHLGRVQGRVPLAYFFIETGDGEVLRSFLNAEQHPFNEVFLRFMDIVEDTSTYPENVQWIDEASIFSGEQVNLAKFTRLLFATAGGSAKDIYQSLSLVMLNDHTVMSDVWWPSIARFRQSEFFRQWVKDQQLRTVWQKNGWPDLCRPLGEDDFECD